MAQSLNEKPDYRNNSPKFVHDMTQSLAFTSSTGMELPIYYDMLHAGDEIHFSGNMFTRLQPLNVASLAEIDIHLDYFYIPLTLLYTPTWSLFYQTDDLVSSVFANGVQNLNASGFPLYNLDLDLVEMRDGVNGFTGGVNADQYKMSSKQSLEQATRYPNAVFDCAGKAASRLLDLFRLNDGILYSARDEGVNPKFTPWFLAAYQAVHEFYYRDTDWEPRSYSYQLDRRYTNVLSPFTDSQLLRLNYVRSYKDYFNSVKVNPLTSATSMLDGGNSINMLMQVNSYLYNRRQTGLTGGPITAATYVPTSPNGDSAPQAQINSYLQNQAIVTDVGGPGNLSAANIRQLYMVDKMLRVTGRAKANYESQFLAHYGIKIPHDELHNITHLGHDKVTLRPNAVISTADTFNGTTGSGLGEVGGQGYVSLSGKKRKFTAPFHGVFLCIYYSMARTRYYGGFDKLHQLNNPMDFWQPEYDRKGMQPLFGFEAYDYLDWDNSASERVGWQYGFEQFKRKSDRVSAAFGYYDAAAGDSQVVNTYNPWVLSSRPYMTPTGLWKVDGSRTWGVPEVFTGFLATPHDIDTMMVVPYQSTWIEDLTYANKHLLFQTDPFIHDFRMDCKKVNRMSVYSEPEID